MLHFDCDYMEGAHPQVLQRLVETNMEQSAGYGFDGHTAAARKLILEACGIPDGMVQFLVGGTQTNATVIDFLLARHEGVLAAESGHINVHESGAIEASGHKVLTLPSYDGKVHAEDVEKYIADFYQDDTYEHMVAPGMLYISHPTEMGTLYSLSELRALSAVCRRAGIPLYMDGARLGYGLAAGQEYRTHAQETDIDGLSSERKVAIGPDCSSKECSIADSSGVPEECPESCKINCAAELPVTLRDIAQLCDVFYIGGTKVGALFGEAVVFAKPRKHFMPLVKQHGALLAKGRLLGVQFETLFTDNLYLRISGHAVAMARRLRAGFIAAGYSPYNDSPTNQQFFLMRNEDMDRLHRIASFELWGPRGENESLVRFVTSWATREEDVDALLAAL